MNIYVMSYCLKTRNGFSMSWPYPESLTVFYPGYRKRNDPNTYLTVNTCLYWCEIARGFDGDENKVQNVHSILLRDLAKRRHSNY